MRVDERISGVAIDPNCRGTCHRFVHGSHSSDIFWQIPIANLNFKRTIALAAQLLRFGSDGVGGQIHAEAADQLDFFAKGTAE